MTFKTELCPPMEHKLVTLAAVSHRSRSNVKIKYAHSYLTYRTNEDAYQINLQQNMTRSFHVRGNFL